jgi:hypothetical protein
VNGTGRRRFGPVHLTRSHLINALRSIRGIGGGGVNGFTRSNEDAETKRSSEPRVRPARNAGRLRRPLVARVFSVGLRCSVAPCETVGSVISRPRATHSQHWVYEIASTRTHRRRGDVGRAVQSGCADEAGLRQRRQPIVQTDFLCDLGRTRVQSQAVRAVVEVGELPSSWLLAAHPRGAYSSRRIGPATAAAGQPRGSHHERKRQIPGTT